jgi:hypothetical protein
MENKILKHRFNKAVNGQSVTIEMQIRECGGKISYVLYVNGCQETATIMGIPNIKGFDEKGQPTKGD